MMANNKVCKRRVAFLQGLPSRIVRRSNYASPITCSHRERRKSSTIPPVLSAVAAAAISFPLISGEREGPQPLYRKLVPAVATAAVATSLLLRRRPKSSRTVLPKQPPDVSNIDPPLQNERPGRTQTTTRNGPFAFDGSRQEWSSSEERIIETPPFETRYEASRSTQSPQDSYSTNSSPKAYDRIQRNMENDEIAAEQSAIGMDTASIFSHMRAEFVSVPSSEQESTQSGNSIQDQEEPYGSLRPPPTTDLPGKEKEQVSVLQPPSSISAADVLRWFVRTPVFILSDVIVPIAQVSSILWYDCKQWILGARNREEKLYFLDDIPEPVDEFNSDENYDRSPWEWNELDVELTQEEKQLKELQDNMRTVFGHVYGTFRRLLG